MGGPWHGRDVSATQRTQQPTATSDRFWNPVDCATPHADLNRVRTEAATLIGLVAGLHPVSRKPLVVHGSAPSFRAEPRNPEQDLRHTKERQHLVYSRHDHIAGAEFRGDAVGVAIVGIIEPAIIPPARTRRPQPPEDSHPACQARSLRRIRILVVALNLPRAIMRVPQPDDLPAKQNSAAVRQKRDAWNRSAPGGMFAASGRSNRFATKYPWPSRMISEIAARAR